MLIVPDIATARNSKGSRSGFQPRMLSGLKAASTLTGLVSLMRFAHPCVLCGISQGVPTDGKISELQNRRIKVDSLMEGNNLSIFTRAIAGPDELPTMIIGVMRDAKDRFLPLKHLPRCKHCTVPRLIKWP
jgi:hypothetical protein